MQASQPAAAIFAGIGVLLSVSFFFFHSVYPGAYRDIKPSQAAKAVSDSQDVLATVFERMENFFRRLETYVEIPPTAGMTDIIVKIMVEVLSILSIATKEIKQSRASELITGVTNEFTMLTYGRLGKYVKKLVGRTDMEDALGRLDGLTQEEARMAAAQGLKVAHEVDDKVKGVDNNVRDAIDLIIGGVLFVLSLLLHNTQFCPKLIQLGNEKIREDVKQVADDMDDQRRSYSHSGLTLLNV